MAAGRIAACMSEEDLKDIDFLQAAREDLDTDIRDKAGVSEYQHLIVSSSDEYKSLSNRQFTHLREQLTVHPFLPKAPSLAEYQFLLAKKGGSLLKEQFEDSWSANTLTIAAVSQIAIELEKLTTSGVVSTDNPIVRATSNAILVSHNQQARAVSTYKYLAKRQANKDTAKPGSERGKILTEQEAKALQAELDTKAKLERTVTPKPFSNRFRGRGRRRGAWWRRRRYGNRGDNPRNNPTTTPATGGGRGRS